MVTSVKIVSIHAFRGEGDTQSPVCQAILVSFNPRLPGGRRLDRRLCV